MTDEYEQTLAANAWHLNQAANALELVTPMPDISITDDTITTLQTAIARLRNKCLTAPLEETA